MPPTMAPSLQSVPPDLITHRVSLHNISWDTYSSLLRDIGDGADRLTYDNGQLEIELPSRLHEQIKAFVAEIAVSTMKKLGIRYEPSGATTWRKHANLKGLEADECYHIQNAETVSGKSELDLTTDPPPDLAIEIEVTPPTIDKVEIYRTLKVPELWRIKGDATCEMFARQSGGDYKLVQNSVAIPLLTSAIISHYLLLREQLNHFESMKRFEADVLAPVSQ